MKESSFILFKRYLWLVSTIKNAGYISMHGINEKWRASFLNEKKEDSIPKKTFFRHKQAVQDLFDISIECRKSDNTYYIEDDLEKDALKRWVLNSFFVYNLLRESYDMKDVVLFERIPSGAEFLLQILNAIKSGHTLKMKYRKFEDEDYKEFEVEPYCLKVNRQRWYVLAKRSGDVKKKTYALDRILSLEETPQTYVYPADFSPQKYFCNSFGIYANEEKKIEEVVIKARGESCNYIRTLPLHSSQKEESHDGYFIFRYKIKIDEEFKAELLRWGAGIEVLQPMELRVDLMESIKKMMEIYKM